jgi:metallo-beta-lactamase family protein
MALLEPRPAGLYCPAGDFHIDPSRPVPRAVLTHAHADHARPGSARYHAAAPGVELLRLRLGPEAPIEGHRYGEPFWLGRARVSLHPAGHILGSAAVVLDIEEKGRKIRLWFSGDIGRERLPLMRDPVLPEKADLLIMECTYGDKPHRDPEEAYIELRDTIRRTVARRGKIIIPAFAVGRTQELVYCLNRMVSQGEIEPLPVYVDSPLAVNATHVFQEHADLFDAETQEFVRNGTHPALTFPQLRYIQSVEESKALNERHEPMIIISASGMAESGRILHHLRNNLQNPRNTILIVSWQAPNTLGRRLAEREPVVRIFGELCDRRAEVVTIGGFSAHAGQDMLVRYAQASQSSIQKLFLVHGEPNAAGALTEKLKEIGFRDIRYPAKGSFFDL